MAEINTADELDIGNRCMVAAQGSPIHFLMVNPPTRATRWTPDEALVIAAWLVAMAQPFTEVKFADVLTRVENT